MEEKCDTRKTPCPWACANAVLQLYHDTEWGIPVHDDHKMFEYLSLESLQCGLSWNLMLKKRAVFRKCFADFDYDEVARYNERDVEHILKTEGMIRSERKIWAIIHNAQCYQKVREFWGSFCRYLWHYSEGKTILYKGHEQGNFPVSNGLSDRISKDLKQQGFKYVGTVTVYSHLQACGIINDHSKNCPCYQKIVTHYPTIIKPQDREVW